MISKLDVREPQVELYMNRRIIISLLLLIAIGQSLNAQTYYYKYTKSIIKGKHDTNVNGGQFITFDGSKCFESDKYGNNVGNGTMAYDAENSKQLKTYWGSCYWSKNAYMKFNADKSVMNIETNSGKIYVYKRATAPAGVTTCSLIRKPEPSSGGSSGGGGYTPSYPVLTNPQGGYAGGGSYNNGNTGNSSSSNSNRYEREKPQKTRHTCTACKGKGTIERNDGTVTTYGTHYKIKCSTCGWEYWNDTFHRHETCKYCHGRGYYDL